MLNVFPGGVALPSHGDEAREFPTTNVPAAASPLRMKFLRSMDNVFMCLCVYVFMLGTLITTLYDCHYTLYLYTFIPLYLYTYIRIPHSPISLLHLYRLKFRKRSLKLRQVGGFV